MTIDLAAVGLILLGAFYVFAGIVGARAALMSVMLDQAIAAISVRKPERAEVLRAAWLLAGANLVLAAGAALTLQLDIAFPLFAISALAQALYLHVVAPRYFDIADPPDPKGRRQTTNAFMIYLGATAIVALAAQSGMLVPMSSAHPALLTLAAGLTLAHAAYCAWHFMRPLGRTDAGGSGNDESGDAA